MLNAGRSSEGDPARGRALWLLAAIRGLLVLAPATLLVFSHRCLYPFVFPKAIAFRVLVEVAFLLYAALLLADPRLRSRPGALETTLLAFLGVLLAADLLGADPWRSLLSSFERMQGFAAVLHLGLYAIVLAGVLRSRQDARRYALVLFSLGIVQACWAFLQVRGLAILPSFQADDRVPGTTGHPAYLASHLSFVALIGLWIALPLRSRKLRLLILAGSAWCLFVTLFTGTRAAVIAVVALGILVFVRVAVFEERRLSILSAASLIVLAAVGFRLLTLAGALPGSSVGRGMQVSVEDVTARARLVVWRISLRAFQERPLLGWGQENFELPFERHYDPALRDLEPWFDRAHNVLLEMLTAAGVPGLVAFLGLFAAVFASLWRAASAGRLGRREAFFLALPFLSYLLVHFFSVQSLDTDLPLFALLGVVASLERRPRSQDDVPRSGPHPRLAAVLTVVAPLVPLWNLEPLRHNLALAGAVQLSESSPEVTPDVRARWREALSYRTFGRSEARERSALLLGAMSGRRESASAERRAIAAAVASELEAEVREHPLRLRPRLLLLLATGQQVAGDPGKLRDLRRQVDEALAISSRRPLTYLAAAEALSLGEAADRKRAVGLARRAVELAPDSEDARVALAVHVVGSGGGDPERRDAEVQAIVEQIPDVSPQSLSRIAAAYEATGAGERARQLYRTASEKLRAAESSP